MQPRLTLKSVVLCFALACGNASADDSSEVSATEAAAAPREAANLPALEAAAQRGDVPALITLAAVYERGEGVERNLLKSNALWCKAAVRGNAAALLRMGQIYGSGREVMRNEGVASLLIAKAAELGNERAKEILSLISRGVGSVMPECMNERLPEPVEAKPVIKVRGDIAQLVQRWAPEYSIDPALVLALIGTESNFNPLAVSPKNAQGLMQLIPATASRFGVKKPFDAVENLKGGLAYLRWLMSYFKGDVALVLAAYNAGEQAVERYRGIPPFRETQQYVKHITNVYRKATHPYQSDLVAPSGRMAVSFSPAGRTVERSSM